MATIPGLTFSTTMGGQHRLVLYAFASLIVLVACTTERERNFPDLFKYPYHGHGDPMLSFHHPFEPDADGDPVSGWVQLGSAMVTSDTHGKEMVRLTTTAQANQGLFYSYTKTSNNDFNGWFDIQINTAPDSHEPADGMGLFFTSQRPVVGSAMGMSHTLQGLGLIIDTFSNSRTRMTPYLYAYVSDGHKAWNPDVDGADTELAKGCHLELNKPIRIFIQFVNGKLSVGVTFTPHNPDHWHTCFTVDHVSLPFSDGGYLSFVGETGHFFAAHDVHGASFVAEHRGVEEQNQRRQRDEAAEREHREREERERRDREYHYNSHDSHSSREQDDRERRDREDMERREREDRDRQSHGSSGGGTAAGALAGNLDKQVADVFSSISEHMRGFSDRDAEDTKNRINGVRDMVTHILHEVSRQRSEVQRVVDTLAHLKESANSLSYATSRFKSHLQTMHKSVDTLRARTHDMSTTHTTLQEHLEEHAGKMHMNNGKRGGRGDTAFFVLFFVLQIMFVAAFVVSSKLSNNSRKLGRMV